MAIAIAAGAKSLEVFIGKLLLVDPYADCLVTSTPNAIQRHNQSDFQCDLFFDDHQYTLLSILLRFS